MDTPVEQYYTHMGYIAIIKLNSFVHFRFGNVGASDSTDGP